MTFPLPDRISVDGVDYDTFSSPLESYFTGEGIARPFTSLSPTMDRGYVASWRIHGDELQLISVRTPDQGDGMVDLFPDSKGAITAYWYSGVIKAHRGSYRYLGVPAHKTYDHVVELQIESGRLTEMRETDNRALPDPTDDELKQTLPPFLWPDRLKDDPPDREIKL